VETTTTRLFGGSRHRDDDDAGHNHAVVVAGRSREDEGDLEQRQQRRPVAAAVAGLLQKENEHEHDDEAKITVKLPAATTTTRVQRQQQQQNGTSTSASTADVTTSSATTGSSSSSSSSSAISKSRRDNGEIEDELQEQIDLSRAAMRLESFEGYVLVSVLTATSSFGAVTELQQPQYVQQTVASSDNSNNIGFFAETIGTVYHATVLAVCCFSALLGMYSAIVFTMVQMYGKTAIGMGTAEKDAAHNQFLERTAQVRVRGFRSAIVSLALFMSGIVLVTGEVLPLPAEAKLAFVGMAAAIGFGIAKDWHFVLKAAEPIFYDDDRHHSNK